MEPDPTGVPSAPSAPAVAALIAGPRLPLLTDYVGHLATTGVSHGLVGPREVPRIWERHVLNCAVIAPLFDRGARVADVGSGAGLPGLVVAIMRPDLQVDLIDPLQRRTDWLTQVAQELNLDHVRVHKAKAEQLWDSIEADAVTSRALASLAEVARLSLPLLRPGGQLVAMKGHQVHDEVRAHAGELATLGARSVRVQSCGDGLVDPPTQVVVADVPDRAARITSPLGGGPALTAAAKRAKAKERRRRARGGNEPLAPDPRRT